MVEILQPIANSFQALVITQALLNEVLLLSDCWLFTWPLRYGRPLVNFTAVTTVAAYAVAEPLWYDLISHLPIDAFLSVLLMGWVHIGSFHAFISLMGQNPDSGIAGREGSLEEKPKQGTTASITDSVEQRASKLGHYINRVKLSRNADLLASIALAITTAGANASWLFWAQSFSSFNAKEWKRKDLYVFTITIWICVSFYWLYKAIITVRLAAKPDWSSMSSIWNNLLRIVLQIFLILVVRAAVRILIGLETTNIATVRVSGSTLVMESRAAQDGRFDTTHSAWLHEALGLLPGFCIPAVSICGTFGAEGILHSALDRGATLPDVRRRVG